MTKSYILLKYLVLTCLLMAAFPAEATCTTHTTQLEPASLVSDNSYQLAKIWFLPDWQADTRSYNTNVGNNVDEENSGETDENTGEDSEENEEFDNSIEDYEENGEEDSEIITDEEE